jgi:hypothetical protein
MQPSSHELILEDPDQVAETFAGGPMSCTAFGSFATLTFTHIRPSVGRRPGVSSTAVVRARVVVPAEGLRSLRDMLNRVLEEEKALVQANSLAASRFN